MTHVTSGQPADSGAPPGGGDLWDCWAAPSTAARASGVPEGWSSWWVIIIIIIIQAWLLHPRGHQPAGISTAMKTSHQIPSAAVKHRIAVPGPTRIASGASIKQHSDRVATSSGVAGTSGSIISTSCWGSFTAGRDCCCCCCCWC
jgi:hypothetical protein